MGPIVCSLMGIPPFGASGHLPRGRHACDLDEFEAAFVTAPQFATSSKRASLFADLLSALDWLADRYSPDLVERAWVGGGFASDKLDPTDIDVTFILSHETHAALGEDQKRRLEKLLRRGGFKGIGLSVDGFMMIRERIALPWFGSGVGDAGQDYFLKRGAWDDWWSRDRAHVAAGEPPVVEDADPVRGYVEVIV